MFSWYSFHSTSPKKDEARLLIKTFIDSKRFSTISTNIVQNNSAPFPSDTQVIRFYLSPVSVL